MLPARQNPAKASVPGEHPPQLPSAQNMHVKMGHFLMAMLPGIGDRAEAHAAVLGLDLCHLADLPDGAVEIENLRIRGFLREMIEALSLIHI